MATFQTALEPNYDEIVKTIDVSHGLLPKLRSMGVLIKEHIEDIEAEKTETNKAKKLLELLERRPSKLLQSFCDALRDTSQQHVADFLSLETNDGLTASSTPLRGNCPVPMHKLCELKKIIEPDYGFPDSLCRLHVITDEQRENINEAKLEVYPKVERLLVAVTGKLMDDRLHEALIETYQEHVSIFIKAGDDSAIKDDNRPIDDQQRGILLYMSHLGLESSKNNTLLDKMVENQCISYLQKLHVASLEDIIESNKRLIRIMLRRSLRDYKRFLCCVKDTQRKEFVEALSKIGALALIKSSVKGEAEEDAVVIEGMMIKLFNTCAARLRQLPERVYALFVTKSNSIDWYFNCRDVESLEHFKKFYESEELLAYLEDFASECKHAGNLEQGADANVTDNMLAQCQDEKTLSFGYPARVQLEVTWEISDYERCRDYFNSSTYAELSNREKDLPFELLESILVKAVVLLFKQLILSRSCNEGIRAVVTVSAVCRRWLQGVAGRKFVRRQIGKTLDYVCRPLGRNFCLQTTLTVKKKDGTKSHDAVSGVATLGYQLFVATNLATTLAVFDMTSFSQQQNIELEVNSVLKDIATCEVTRRIYIADSGNKCVWRIDWPSSSSSAGAVAVKSDKFIHSLNYWPWKLSTHASRQQLLVTDARDDLYVYDVDGKLLRRVVLGTTHGSGLRRYEMHHAVQAATDDTYFVCHYVTKSTSYRSRAEVAEYDAKGKILRLTTLRQPSDIWVSDLVRPAHLLVQLFYMTLFDDEHLLVADRGSHRVLMLNTTHEQLRLERVLATIAPSRLCYNSETRLLCIGSSSGCVKVYNIS